MEESVDTSGDRLKGKKRKFPNGSTAAKDEFVNLRAEGRSYDEIAGILNVSRQCLQNWSRDLQNQLENTKAFHLDAIKAKYKMLQAHRVEEFSIMLHRLREEVAKRDLSDVPTDKLLDLFIKFTKEARNEDVELHFTEVQNPYDSSPMADTDMWNKRRPMP